MSAYTDDEWFTVRNVIVRGPHSGASDTATRVLDAVAPAIAARALREFATDRVIHQTPARLIEDMFARADEIEAGS